MGKETLSGSRKVEMQLYRVSWHDSHSRYNGWDLVYAQNKEKLGSSHRRGDVKE